MGPRRRLTGSLALPLMLGLLPASLAGAEPGMSDRELVVTFTVEVSGLEAFALGKCVDLPNPYRESNPLKLVICHANDRPTTGDILDHVPFVLPSSRSLDASHHWA